MNQELSNLIAELESVTADAQAKFGGLTGEQLNWKPSAESWSVGQCFDHLIAANNGMLSKIEPVVDGDHKTTFFERLPLLPRLFGGLVRNAVDPKTVRKTKNPGIFDPAGSDVAANVIEKFGENQKRVLEVMQTSRNIDLEKTIMTSPVAVFVTYRLLDGYRIIVSHERRHLQQAESVTQTKGFPD